MKALHLFDTYLPHTMNWAYRIMVHTPDVETWVAAPHIVWNDYHDPAFRFWTRPLQAHWGFRPNNEWQWGIFYQNLARVERRWPIYRNWLYKQLKNNPPDVLHAHFGPVGCHFLPLAAALKRPFVVSFYGYDYRYLPTIRPEWREKYRQLGITAAAITATGSAAKELLQGYGIPAEKIVLSPMAMQPADFPFIKRTKLVGSLKLLQVATVTGKKGFLHTLQAFAKALPQCMGMTLTLAGELYDRDLAQEMQVFIQKNNLAQAVNWLDFVPHDQLPALFSAHHVFIQPSITTGQGDCEGGPVSILEAQASGMLVLATRHMDIPAAVLDGHTGMLASEGDVDSLASHIVQCYRMDQASYDQFAAAAHAHVKANFDVAQTGIRLQALYKSLCK